MSGLRYRPGVNRQRSGSKSGGILLVSRTTPVKKISKTDSFRRYMYYVVYTLGFIGIPFLYASEVAPVQLRGPICGLSTAVSWLFNYLVVEITPVGFTDISYRYL